MASSLKPDSLVYTKSSKPPTPHDPRWKDRLGAHFLRGPRSVEDLKIFGVPYQQGTVEPCSRHGRLIDVGPDYLDFPSEDQFFMKVLG